MIAFPVLASILTAFLILPQNAVLEPTNPILIHAVFRHGDRANDEASTYPNDPHKNENYYPTGIGQLTNKGRLREFRLGDFLRKRYNKTLGDLYTPEILEARTTGYNRTKASLELVLAGLYPPNKELTWNSDLNWQPIPYNYVPTANDTLLFTSQACPNFKKEYTAYLKENNGKDHTELYQYLKEHTGFDEVTLQTANLLYFGLTTEKEWGLELPEWTKKVLPEPLQSLAVENYLAQTGTLQLRKTAAGPLLQKIVKDTQAKINGSLSPQERKLFLYSGHELNVAHILNTLDIFDHKVPNYGACVIFEIHENKGTYGVKIYYETNSLEEEKTLLKLPNCEELCPLEKFVSLVEKYFPDEDTCGN